MSPSELFSLRVGLNITIQLFYLRSSRSQGLKIIEITPWTYLDFSAYKVELNERAHAFWWGGRHLKFKLTRDEKGLKGVGVRLKEEKRGKGRERVFFFSFRPHPLPTRPLFLRIYSILSSLRSWRDVWAGERRRSRHIPLSRLRHSHSRLRYQNKSTRARNPSSYAG